MSADNWAICPRCVAEAEALTAVLLGKAEAAYGVVPAEEYKQLFAEANVEVDEEDYRTFREDYEFYGAEDGTITASYSGHCQNCNLGVDFNHTHPFFPVAS